MPKQLIVSDLDGTLLNASHEISLQSASAILRYQEEGGLFTIATGRMEASVRRFTQVLDLKLPMILYNGARIVMPHTEQVLYEQTLQTPAHFWEYLQSVVGSDTGLLVYYKGQCKTPQRNCHVLGYEKKEQVWVERIHELESISQVTKIMLISHPDLLAQIEQLLVISYGAVCDLVSSEPEYLEILPKNVSKGKTLTLMLEYMLKKDHESLYSFAVGDNLNDISLLEAADFGVAVANALPPVKKVADEVVRSNEDHALVDVISKMIRTG